MKTSNILAAMVSPLCSWYQKNKRQLPWRENRAPYRVWVSEIMLQQTRVEAALPYYQRFLEALPTVEDLAKAPEERLLKLWEGLGYYSRVRNMQKAAQIVMEQYGGEFPADFGLLAALPGIGEYTAGAVASISFGLPEPAVDGNVLRVLARLQCDDTDIMLPQAKRQAKQALSEVYSLAEDSGDLTQAIMELGALICIPGGVPKCGECPLEDLCLARKNGKEQQLPVRNSKKEKKLVKRTVFLIACDGKLALVKRPEGGVLAGMWEFPAVDGHLLVKEAEEVMESWGGVDAMHKLIRSRHVFTHLIWDMESYFVYAKHQKPDFFWVTPEKLLKEIPMPSAMKPFCREIPELDK